MPILVRFDARRAMFPFMVASVLPLKSEIFKPDVLYRILFPILVVEVPPLVGVYREALFFHRLAQQSPASPLIGGAPGIIGKRPLGHLVVPAGHLYFLAGLQIV